MRRRAFVLAAGAAVATPMFAWAQTTTPRPAPTPQQAQQITPENDLERAFLAAFGDPEQRLPFRRELLRGQVALALANNSPDSPPRFLALQNALRAGFIFTSAARLASVLGPAAPRVIVTGRVALTRLRGSNVVLNFRLSPMLTLEASDVAEYLAT